MSDYETALKLLNDVESVNAHTHGGGMNNDLTVQLNTLATLHGETIEKVKECGFELESVGTAHPVEHDWMGLLTFSEADA